MKILTNSLRAMLAIVPIAGILSGKIPTAYITGGGGFKTMTESMGIIRAFDDAGLLDLATHFGGCSGGFWFQTQFSYSSGFYQDTLGLTGKTVSEAVTDWGAAYEQSMAIATAQSLFENITFTVQTQSSLCVLEQEINGTVSLADVIEVAVNALLTSLGFPASDWFFYVGALIGTTLLDPSSTQFSAPRAGHPDGTLIAVTTLPPDIWDSDAQNTPKLINQPEDITFLPVSFVASPNEDGKWVVPSTSQELQVSNKPGPLSPAEVVDLDMNPMPSFTEVAAASSSAVGLLGSPTLFGEFVSSFLDSFENLTFVERTALEAGITACEPFGLQHLASPTYGNESSTATRSWGPLFRYMDGGYSDCSAIPSTIREMQQECSASDSGLDCSQGGRVTFIMGSAMENFNTTQRLFANCDCGTSNYEEFGASINPQIFAEDFPWDQSGPEWTLTSNYTYDFSDDGEPSITYALRVPVTTVTNEGFNVSAGMAVDLVIIYVDIPSSVPTAWPGWNAETYFSDTYAEIAQVQYDSLGDYFAEIADDWVPDEPVVGGSAKKTKEAKGKKTKEAKDAKGKKAKEAKEAKEAKGKK